MAVYTDAFTGTNDTALTTHNAAWVQGTSSGVMEIQSNGCAGNADASDGFYYYNQTFAAAHYSQCVLAAAGTESIGVVVRAQTAAKSCYYAGCWASGGLLFAGETIAGTDTDWDSGQVDPNVGQSFGLYIDETTTTTVYYKVNGATIATYTSKSALTGGKAGVWRFQGSTGTRIDDWEGGDVGGVAAAFIPLSRIIRQAVIRASRY